MVSGGLLYSMGDIKPLTAHVEAFAYNFDDSVLVEALRMAKTYGSQTTHSPRVTAAGAIYTGALIADVDVTQANVAEATNVSRMAVSSAHRSIMDEYEAKRRQLRL